jgi:tetratricopeptide (TPR) repeat protein
VISSGRISARLLGAVALCAAALAATGAVADDVGSVEAEVRDIHGKANGLAGQYLRAGGMRGEHYAAERLIDGENFYRLKDYQRAAIIFMDLIETYPNDVAYPDALFYFADALFLSRDYYGAREWFGRVLDEGGRPGMARFRLKAMGRLIEIAIHVNQFDNVGKYIDQLGQSPAPEASYIKGKYYYFKGELDRAREEFQHVSGDAELELKAAYFVGAIYTKQNRFDDAIAAFTIGKSRKATTPAEKEVLDLLNLGLGRLYFEKDQYGDASKAYAQVGEYSLYYDMALYEAASVKIKAGDPVGAERLLEVLTIAVPDSRLIPRAKLLRGNLLLHAGRYTEAEKVFEETIGEFTPVRDQLDKITAEQSDTRAFFAALMERSFTALDVAGALPPLVVKWVGEEPDVQRALALTADLSAAREYTRETERLLRLVEAVIDGPSRVNAFPALRGAMRRSQQMSNRLGQLRARLLDLAQQQVPGGDQQLGGLAAERRKLEAQIASLPTSDEAYQRREEKARAVYVHLKQELARNEVRIDRLNAMIVALERFVADPSYTEGAAEENVRALRDELDRHRAGAEQMRADLTALREDVEGARYQVGVGDSQDRADAQLREKMRQLCAKERTLIVGRGGEVGARLDRALGSIEQAEKIIAEFRAAAEKEADRQIDEMRLLVRGEREHVAQYREELASLGSEAEEVVGGVTFENFSSVRRKFHSLILKADVGVIDVAWMRKEQHKERGASFNKERLAEIQDLDSVFEEVKSGSSVP